METLYEVLTDEEKLMYKLQGEDLFIKSRIESIVAQLEHINDVAAECDSFLKTYNNYKKR